MLKVYEVNSPGGNVRRIEAKDSRQAKRIYCKLTGRKPGDPWSGVSVLKTKQVKENLTGGEIVRGLLYKLARILGDYNAVRKGKVARRAGRRAAGTAAGKGLKKLFK